MQMRASEGAAAGADKGVSSAGGAGGGVVVPILKDSLIIMQLLKNNLSMWTEST